METMVKDYFTPLIDWKFVELLHNCIQECLDNGINISFGVFIPKYKNYNHQAIIYEPFNEDRLDNKGWPKDFTFLTYKNEYKKDKKICYNISITDKVHLTQYGGDVGKLTSYINEIYNIEKRIKNVYKIETDGISTFIDNGAGSICINFITKPKKLGSKQKDSIIHRLMHL